MSDTNELETVPKGNEWEVVALTDSAYAAAPGPKPDTIDQGQGNLIGEDNTETPDAMFMSGHFGVLPKVHENSLAEPSSKEQPCGMDGDYGVPEVMVQQGGKSDLKHEDDMHIEGLISVEFPGVPELAEKGQDGSLYSSDIGVVASSNLMEKEQDMYNIENFGSYDDEATAGQLGMAEDSEIAEPFESLVRAANTGRSNVQKDDNQDEFNKSPSLPHESWWRWRAATLYDQAKNANPFWSIVVAAAVVGLVIIGHRWQRDKPQALKLKAQLIMKDEGSGWILAPMARLKDVSLGSQNSSYIRASSSSTNF